MINPNESYIWQLVSAEDGTRSEPFISTPLALKNRLSDSHQREEDQLRFYVLLLADFSNPNVEQFVSRFPLYRVSTFLNTELFGDNKNV